MERKKEISHEFKNRLAKGGVYVIRNKENCKYLLTSTPNLSGARNRFQFSLSTSSCVHPKLEHDWITYDKDAFSFETLESLEQKETQTRTEFLRDLKTLEDLWRDKLKLETEQTEY